MAERRRFELVEGSSKKFWEIAIDGDAHTVRYGRIGASGTEKTKRFASVAAARADAEKLVREKLGKGYVEVVSATISPGASAPAPAPRGAPQPEVAKPVAKARSSATPGVRTTLKPPRGLPTIVLLLAGAELSTNGVTEAHASAAEAKRAFDRVVREKTKQGYQLGAVEIVADTPPVEEEEYVHVEEAPQADPPSLEHDAHGRLVVTFQGGIPLDETGCRALVDELTTRAPALLQLVCDHASPGEAWAQTLGARALPSVKAFIFDTHFQTQARQSENSLGDLGATLRAMPALERLFATGALGLSPTKHLALRELSLLGDPLPQAVLAGLGGSELPALEALVLSLASDAGPVDAATAVAALLSLEAPSLRRVHLCSAADAAGALELLLSSPRTGHWSELAVEGTLDEDAALELVERHRARLAQLERIALPLGDYLSSEAEARLRERCPTLCDVSELDDPTLPDAYAGWR